ncbi:MAG TPA: ABC transporter ATP-binding protein [Tepidisphaeraceae bacterium]|jgi:lipopolysaccharide transport system ATP-binding protein|nr:ABC transporter ATP-binding protein [Tepidisphaeraceae bacterium]
MSSSDIALSVRGLGKSYTIAHDTARHVTLAESMLHRLRHPFQRQQKETFWALNDVSFDIKKGDVVGIIGRNGAGKSTLLKILSRITEPTKGEIDLYGRIGSLLEVGTGFHPELTGRENIYLNGHILGMRKKEIDKQFDAIVDFSGVEQFLDTPVKRYSSGMYVRLAFAVAAHLETEILVVDEVLAVGDIEFQKKCMGKMKDVATAGKTVLFVSHSMNAIHSLCTHAVHLKKGRIAEYGNVEGVVGRYVTSMPSLAQNDLKEHSGRGKGSDATLLGIEIENECGDRLTAFKPNEIVVLRLEIKSERLVREPRVGVGINNARGDRVFAVATFLSKDRCSPIRGQASVTTRFRLPAVVPGQYTLDIGLTDGPSHFIDAVYGAAAFDVIDDNYLGTAFTYFSEMGSLMVRSEWESTPQT